MGKKNKNKKRRQNKRSAAKHAAAEPAKRVKPSYSPVMDIKTMAADILAAVPGLLMCAMILVMLICDVLMQDMGEKQYDLFQQIFRVIDPAIAVCGVVYLILGVSKKEITVASIRNKAAAAFFTAFAVLIIASTCVNGFSSEAIRGIPYRDIGIFSTISFLLIYMGVSSSVSRDSLKNAILLSYIAVADAVGVAVLYDSFVSRIDAFHEKKELSAVFFNGNHYGYFLVMAVLIGIGWYIYGKGRAVQAAGIISAALNALLLAMNHSMGCIVAVLAVFIVMAADILIKEMDKRRRTAVLIVAVIVSVAAALVQSADLRSELAELTSDITAVFSGTADGSVGHNRLMLWDITCEFIKSKPLLGYGCEGMSIRLFAATERSNPHNEILTYAAYYGIPAAVCYVLGVITIFVGYFRNRRTATASARIACMAAAGYFISSITGVAMFYTVPFFFIFLGIAAAE